MRSTSASFVFLLVVATAALIWCPALSSSLWLDELDTYFAAKDGVVTAFYRTVAAHPQCSTLYNAIIALVIEWIGHGEATLRIPSVVASAFAALFLYRLGARLVDRETGLLAALLYVAFGDVAFAAADARPYAFASATCVASTYYLLRLLALPTVRRDDEPFAPRDRSDRRRDAIAYALMAAAMIQFHSLYALALLAHVTLVTYLMARGELTASRRDLATSVAVGFVALLPALGPFLDTVDARHSLAYAPHPTLGALLSVWARPEIVMSTLPLVLFAAGSRIGARFELPTLDSASWILLLTWAVAPPAMIFAVSELSTVSMFIPRYFLSAAPALALIVAVCLRGLDPPALRTACAIAYAVLSIVVHSRDVHVAEDWRAVSAAVRAEVDAATPVLLDSGFVEGARSDWLALPPRDDRHGFLVAPATYYPLGDAVSPLPYLLNDETSAYLEQVIVPALIDVERFVCIGRGKRATWWRPWFDARYLAAGYRVRDLYRSELLNAVVYERKPRYGSEVPAR